MNKLELSDQKYQTNGNVRYENYKGKFLLPMKDFVLSGTGFQSMYFMSTIFLKDNIYGFRVPLFQLAYIRDTTHPSLKISLSCVVKYIVCDG